METTPICRCGHSCKPVFVRVSMWIRNPNNIVHVPVDQEVQGTLCGEWHRALEASENQGYHTTQISTCKHIHVCVCIYVNHNVNCRPHSNTLTFPPGSPPHMQVITFNDSSFVGGAICTWKEWGYYRCTRTCTCTLYTTKDWTHDRHWYTCTCTMCMYNVIYHL